MNDKISHQHLLTLCYIGTSLYNINVLFGIDQVYQQMFDYMFDPGDALKAKLFHKFIALTGENLRNLLPALFTIQENKTFKTISKINKSWVDEFLITFCRFEKESLGWVANLTRIALGDLNAIDFIRDHFELSGAASNLCKSICSDTSDQMGPLFQALRDIVSYLQKYHN